MEDNFTNRIGENWLKEDLDPMDEDELYYESEDEYSSEKEEE